MKRTISENIEGDYFVLRYSEMSTINLDYVFVTPESEELPEETSSSDVA